MFSVSPILVRNQRSTASSSSCSSNSLLPIALVCCILLGSLNPSLAWIAVVPSTVTTTTSWTSSRNRVFSGQGSHKHVVVPRVTTSLGLYPKATSTSTSSKTSPPSPFARTTFLEVFTSPYQNATMTTWVEEEPSFSSSNDQATLLQHAQGMASLGGLVLTDEAMYHHHHHHHTKATTATLAPLDQTAAKDDDGKATLWARLLLIGAAALYGTNFSLVKLMGESDIPVGLSSTIRFGMAALVTSPWLFAKPKSTSSAADAWPAMIAGFEVGLCNSFGYVAQAVGLETTAASVSAFLCSLAVVVVPFLDVWSGKQLKGRQWVGALLALAGVANLELGHGVATGTLTGGELASMLQPLAFGLGFCRLERAMHQWPDEGKRGTAAQLWAIFLGCILYTAKTESVTMDQLQSYLMDPATMALFFWTGVISTALSVYMESVALMTLTAAETTLLLSTEPLWGALWAAILVGEQLGTDTFVGGFLILAACLYSSLGWNKLKDLVLTGKMSASTTS